MFIVKASDEQKHERLLCALIENDAKHRNICLFVHNIILIYILSNKIKNSVVARLTNETQAEKKKTSEFIKFQIHDFLYTYHN